MPLLFGTLCSLLSELESIANHDPPYLPANRYERQKSAVARLCSSHKLSIREPVRDIVDILSAFFPAKRSDRVYNIQTQRLCNLLKRCLRLGIERQKGLDVWKIPGRGELADCVERIMQQTDDALTLAKYRMTLGDVEAKLDSIAAKSRFSGSKIRERENDTALQRLLEDVYGKLHSREAKWFTRMILKDFSCLDLEPNLVYRALDPRLPLAMRLYDDFEAAVIQLQGLPASQTASISRRAMTERYANEVHLLRPKIGVKVGPANWLKAKGGVKHAINVIDGRPMSIERKHDGEYCQIHIDLTKGDRCIQIFSKSGKDSTVDRSGVHDAIKQGLRIGTGRRQFSRTCILEGEMLVWDERTSRFLEFHKIRKHVSRSGSMIGTEKDSCPHHWEKLMIVFYDVLLVDDDPVIHKVYEERRQILSRLVKRVKGRSDLVWRKVVDFSTPEGPQVLRKALAFAFVRRWEGLVLKPATEPYFDRGAVTRGHYPARWIKLKKDCIKGLGDTADMAIIGAGYDAQLASNCKVTKLHWTHFFIACLKNKEGVLSRGEKADFLVFDCVKDCINPVDLQRVNELGYLRQMAADSAEVHDRFNLDIVPNNDRGIPGMDVIFRQPFVFEIAGSGFDKPPSRGIFTLRFPRVVKFREDRDWKDAIGLDELQKLANEARTVPSGDLQTEVADWMRKLREIDCGSKGNMTSWDHTDDEDTLHSLLLDSDAMTLQSTVSSALSPLKPIERARNSLAPPLIRMDTQEMAPDEQRQSNGLVVQMLGSQHAEQRPSYVCLPTQPRTIEPSSSHQADTISAHSKTRSTTRKRTSEAVLHKTTNPKKARQASPTQANENSVHLVRSLQPRQTRPLQELTNLGHNDRRERKIMSGRSSKTESANRDVKDTTKGKERETSQIIPIRGLEGSLLSHGQAGTAGDHPRPVPSLAANNSAIVNPGPSTPASAITGLTAAAAASRIPNFKKCRIILCPRMQVGLFTMLTNYLGEHYRRPLTGLSDPLAPHNSSINTTGPTLMLVNVDEVRMSRRTICTVARRMQKWQQQTVEIWDYRILNARRLGEENEKSEAVVIEDMFVALVSQAPAQPDGEQFVVIQWAGGHVMTESVEWLTEREYRY